MVDSKILQARLGAARRQLQDLQIMQMRPGQPPEKLELLRDQEQLVRAVMKKARRGLVHRGWRRIWRRSTEL